MARATRRHHPEPASGGVAERILDAAIALLRESGVQRLTQVEVAARAGVRQSHLTYYFPTREDLLDAMTTRAVEGIAGAVRRVVGDQADAGQRDVPARLADAVADLQHMRMFVGLIVEADGDPAIRATLVAGTHRLEAAIAGALGGTDAPERARLVLAAVWGLGLYRFVVRPPPEADPTLPYLRWITDPPATPRKAGRRGHTT
jgi:AcrR family transcriptional regulator